MLAAVSKFALLAVRRRLSGGGGQCPFSSNPRLSWDSLRVPDYDLLISRLNELGAFDASYRNTLQAVLREVPPLSGGPGLVVFEKVVQQVALLDAAQAKRHALIGILETARDEGWPPKSPFE